MMAHPPKANKHVRSCSCSCSCWCPRRQVTFHEEDWKTWKEVTEPARALTVSYFSADNPPEGPSTSTTSQSPAAAQEEGQDRNRRCDSETRQPSETSAPAAPTATAAPESDSPSVDGTDRDTLSSGADTGSTSPESAGANANAKKHPAKSHPSFRNSPAGGGGAAGASPPAADQAKNDRLCQAIADRVEVRFEGGGGKLALRAPRRRGEGSGGAGAGASGGHRSFGSGIGVGGGEGISALQEDGEDDDDRDDDDGGDGAGDSDGGLYGGGGGVGGGRGLGGDEVGNQEKGKVRKCMHYDKKDSRDPKHMPNK